LGRALVARGAAARDGSGVALFRKEIAKSQRTAKIQARSDSRGSGAGYGVGVIAGFLASGAERASLRGGPSAALRTTDGARTKGGATTITNTVPLTKFMSSRYACGSNATHGMFGLLTKS
jgi:hypothetical protein